MSNIRSQDAGVGHSSGDTRTTWKGRILENLGKLREHLLDGALTRLVDNSQNLVNLTWLSNTKQLQSLRIASKVQMLVEVAIDIAKNHSDGNENQVTHSIGEHVRIILPYLEELNSCTTRRQAADINAQERLSEIEDMLGLVMKDAEVMVMIQKLRGPLVPHLAKDSPVHVDDTSPLSMRQLSTSMASKRKPPPKPSIFLGRNEVLERVFGSFQSSTPQRIILSGPPGIGKTAVLGAIWDASRLKNRFDDDHRIFICYDREEARMLEYVFEKISLILRLPRTTNDSVHEAVLEALSVMTDELLVVLDSFEMVWDTEDQSVALHLLESLCNNTRLHLVVAMRGHVIPQIAWTEVISLEGLPQDVSMQLFRRLPIKQAEPAHILHALLELLDGLPLAIHLMAVRGQLRTPGDLIAFCRSDPLWLKEMLKGAPQRTGGLKESIEISLRLYTMTTSHMEQYLPAGGLQWEEAAISLEKTALASTTSNAKLRVLRPIANYIKHTQPPDGEVLQHIQHFCLSLTHIPSRLTTPATIRSHENYNEHLANVTAILHDMWVAQTPNELPSESLLQATRLVASTAFTNLTIDTCHTPATIGNGICGARDVLD